MALGGHRTTFHKLLGAPAMAHLLQVGTCAAVNMMGMPYKLYQSPRYRLIVDREVVEQGSCLVCYTSHALVHEIEWLQ